MHKKSIFTPEELHGIFNNSDSQKYNITKKDLAKIILRYLTANSEVKRGNEDIYEKALAILSKNILYNPTITTSKQAIELAEMSAKSDVALAKENYTSHGVMQLIMQLFLSLE